VTALAAIVLGSLFLALAVDTLAGASLRAAERRAADHSRRRELQHAARHALTMCPAARCGYCWREITPVGAVWVDRRDRRTRCDASPAKSHRPYLPEAALESQAEIFRQLQVARDELGEELARFRGVAGERVYVGDIFTAGWQWIRAHPPRLFYRAGRVGFAVGVFFRWLF
jgi:hypothetical protein